MNLKRLIGVLSVLLAASTPSFAFRHLQLGDRMKDFSLVGFGGEVVRLDSFLGGKGTLVAFWATWSPRSGEALADLQKLYEKYGPGDLRVVAVNLEQEKWEPGEIEKVWGFVARSGVNFPVVVDADLTLFERYGVTVLPSMVFIDPRGTVIAELSGYPETMRSEFWGVVQGVLGPVPPEASGHASRQPAGDDGTQDPNGRALR